MRRGRNASCALGLGEKVPDTGLGLRADHLGDDFAVLEGQLQYREHLSVHNVLERNLVRS